MTLRSVTKASPCPVCGTATKGCAYNDKATNFSRGLYLCRGESLSDEFTFLKEDKTNTWGIYAHSEDIERDKEEWQKNQEERKKLYREREQRKWESEQQERLRLATLLSVEERHERLLHLLSQLPLLDKHRKELRRRGLNDSQIERIGFKSIRRYQSFFGVDGLPGMNQGKYIGVSGIICPIRNIDGYLIGFQIKNDSPEKIEVVRDGVKTTKIAKKYVWTVSGDTSAHLQNGEMPLNVCHHGETVGLCEGILKPSIGASRHNISLIGASGNIFYPEQLKAALSKLNPLFSRPVIIFPDAGFLLNDGIYRSTIKNIAMVKSLGYQVKVADWGHWCDKKAGDIDEIHDLKICTYRTTDELEFFRQHFNEYSPNDNHGSISLEKFLKSLFSNLVGNKARRRRKIELVAQEKQWHLYHQGDLPYPSQGIRAIEFEGSATPLYEELSRKGYKYALDISQTGAGKTHAAAHVIPSDCFVDSFGQEEKYKLFHLSTQSRNPNIAKLESDFTELPARNQGYDYDLSKLTPLGLPYRHHSKSVIPDTRSSCHLAESFQVARSNNADIDICQTCKFNRECRVSEGKGYGFKYQAKVALKANKIRANPQGISPEMVNDKAVAIVDEYNQSVKWEQFLEITKEDILATWVLFWNIEIAEELKALIKALHDAIDNDSNYYGRSTKELLATLPNIDLKSANDAISFAEKAIAIGNDKAHESKTPLQKNWLREMVEVVSGHNSNSSLHQVKGKITITLRNQRVLQSFRNCHNVIFQDATGSRLDLALKLGCNPEDILVVRHRTEAPDNIIVHHVQGFGIAGNRRSAELEKRIAVARDAIAALHPDVGFIDFKKYAQSGDLTHFADARGSNLFQSKKAVASFGVPFPRLSTLLSQYETYTGARVGLEHEDFQLFLNEKVASEAIQEIGRLRANRRKDEQLDYYLCGDCDLTFLEQLGYEIKVINAVDLHFDAGDKQSKARHTLSKAFSKLINRGEEIANITQQRVAQLTLTSQQAISALASKLGGWQKLKEIIGSLLHKDRQDITELKEELVWQAQSYLPEVFKCDLETIGDELASLISAYEKDAVDRIFYHTPPEAIANLLTKLLKHHDPNSPIPTTS